MLTTAKTTYTWEEITSTRPETPAQREAYERGRREVVAESIAENLSELRKMRAVTQVELARQLGITQPALSGLEHRDRLLLATLRGYIEGLGGQLEVSAVFDDVRVPLSFLFQPPNDVIGAPATTGVVAPDVGTASTGSGSKGRTPAKQALRRTEEDVITEADAQKQLQLKRRTRAASKQAERTRGEG